MKNILILFIVFVVKCTQAQLISNNDKINYQTTICLRGYKINSSYLETLIDSVFDNQLLGELKMHQTYLISIDGIPSHFNQKIYFNEDEYFVNISRIKKIKDHLLNPGIFGFVEYKGKEMFVTVSSFPQNLISPISEVRNFSVIDTGLLEGTMPDWQIFREYIQPIENIKFRRNNKKYHFIQRSYED